MLAEHAKRRQALASKALDATIKSAQADVFMEWFFFWQPGNKDDLWEAGFRFGAVGLKAHADHIPDGYKGRLGDRAIKSLNQLRTPPTLEKFQTSDGPWRRPDGTFDSTGVWMIRTDVLPAPGMELILGAVRDECWWGDLSRSYLYLLDQVSLPHYLRYSVVVCDGGFGAVRADQRLPLLQAIDSIIVSRRDIRGVGGRLARGVVVVAGGDVFLEDGTFEHCVILAGGKVHRPGRGVFKNCRIESDVKDATAPFKFFELADVGLAVAKPADKAGKGVAVESVRENTPFGSAGVAKGDTILAIDGDVVTTPEEFRKQVRKAMVVHGDCLLSVSRGGKTLELPVYFPLPQ